jgi:mannose-6-phosphate isomerase-like protein (cupin superfamily)
MIKGKQWGTTEALLSLPGIEVHRINVVPGGFCSWHSHGSKWNAFVLVEGSLSIERGGQYSTSVEAGSRDKLVMQPGDFTTIPPGEWHRFANESRKKCLALEVYYPAALSEDIVRETTGGVLK